MEVGGNIRGTRSVRHCSGACDNLDMFGRRIGVKVHGHVRVCTQVAHLRRRCLTEHEESTVVIDEPHWPGVLACSAA